MVGPYAVAAAVAGVARDDAVFNSKNGMRQIQMIYCVRGENAGLNQFDRHIFAAAAQIEQWQEQGRSLVLTTPRASMVSKCFARKT